MCDSGWINCLLYIDMIEWEAHGTMHWVHNVLGASSSEPSNCRVISLYGTIWYNWSWVQFNSLFICETTSNIIDSCFDTENVRDECPCVPKVYSARRSNQVRIPTESTTQRQTENGQILLFDPPPDCSSLHPSSWFLSKQKHQTKFYRTIFHKFVILDGEDNSKAPQCLHFTKLLCHAKIIFELIQLSRNHIRWTVALIFAQGVDSRCSRCIGEIQ